MSPGAEVTCLDATDLGTEMPGLAQKKILRGRYLGAVIHGAEVAHADAGSLAAALPRFPCSSQNWLAEQCWCRGVGDGTRQRWPEQSQVLNLA